MSIDKLVETLQARSELSLAIIEAALAEVVLDEHWLAEHRPDPLPTTSYGRTLLYGCDRFEVVLATWPVGVMTLPHNHGVLESQGMVRVLKGTILNEVYEIGEDDQLREVARYFHGTGDFVAVPKDLVHRMGNQDSEGYAYSLHVYNPAIVDVRYWDPVHLTPLEEVASARV